MLHLATSFFRSLRRPLLRAQKDYKIQSFTFFIPAPPVRTSGYREKQFDKLFYEFINRGYDILNFRTEAISSGDKCSGMWVILIVRATNPFAQELQLDDAFTESVEGLYALEDEASLS